MEIIALIVLVAFGFYVVWDARPRTRRPGESDLDYRNRKRWEQY